MLAFAIVECGLSEEKFWRLTPCKLFALVRAKQEQIKREDYRTGTVTMVVRAALGTKNVNPFDFFPQHKEASGSSSRGITSPEEVRANFKAYIEAVKQHGEAKEKSG